ncbi:MAG TPA: BglII/BstYI family type II restriction endonuclease [Candidatus Acidoferrales bacterium]
MQLRTHDYRHAEIILNSSFRLKKQIERVLGDLQLQIPRGRAAECCPPHRQVQRAFVRRGWKGEVLVSPRTSRRHYFDLLKERVAIEIEFSNRELLYRDYMRFLMAQGDGRIDVGVIVMLDADACYVHPWGGRNGLPRLDDAVDDLTALAAHITVPIWLIALS